ncbi:MAG: hypothetical protein CMP76_17150 [Flavobacterium sp.]|uniref:hypothetical protein n=1 Tax=Flavobacterium sp. TaxID=239 RepID=UPI000C46B72C|nr:hypothetical protein [Flavobacterium sp.]MBF05006.1 hypothetical protein [Flavobacterium sp.]|tara:strand:+ start:1955 stop:2362 length:408 start_codon:yes stop_codon:yes gene_type:complete
MDKIVINESFKIDCMRFMCWLDRFSYYVGIVDPVYGINGNSHRKNRSRGKLTQGKNYHNDLWYQSKTSDEYFKELKRVTRHQIIFGANYFPSVTGNEFKTPRREEYDNFLKEHPTNWIIWDKVNGNTSFNDCELI